MFATRYQSLRLLSFTSLALCVLTVQFLQADEIASEKRLPPGVLLHFSIPDFPDLGMKMKDTSMGALINDPALEDIRVQFLDKIGELSEGLESELGFPLSDLEALLAGELSISVVRPIGQTLGVVSTLYIGDHKDVLDQLLVKVEEELNNKGAEKEIDTLDGTEITLYSVPPEGDSPNAKPMTFAYMYRDETFVVASTTSLLESVLDRWDGDHPETFADSKVYNTIISKCSSNADSKPVIKWYANPVSLSLAVLSMVPETQMASAMASAYLPTLGLNKLKAIGGAVEMATPEFDSISRTMIYAEAPPTGLLKVFSFPSTIEAPPAWVPQEAGSYFGFHWDLLSAWNAIESMYDSFLGQPGGFERMVTNAAKRADGPDLHPKKDVIDVLSGVLHGYVSAAGEGDNTPVTGVVAFGVKDETKAFALIEAMAASANLSTTEVQGVTIYTTDNGAAAVYQGMVYISGSQARLEQTMFGGVEPLSKSERFQSVAAHLPPKSSILTYAGNANQWEQGYNSVRDGKLDGLTEGDFDFSVLPPFEVISSYILPSTSYTVEDEQGCLFVQFTARRQVKAK